MLELCQDGGIHDVVLNLLPVSPQGVASIAADTSSFQRRWGAPDFFAEFFILKFLRLEVMFCGAPVNIIFVKPVAGEVG